MNIETLDLDSMVQAKIVRERCLNHRCIHGHVCYRYRQEDYVLGRL